MGTCDKSESRAKQLAGLRPFKKGQGAPLGNKNAAKPPQYKKVIKDIVTVDEWAEVVHKALEQARDGDKDARKWLSDILISKNVRMAGGASLKLSGEDAQKQIDLLFGLVASVERTDDGDSD